MSQLESQRTKNASNDDIDDDDDQLNSSHKIIPAIHESTASETTKEEIQLPEEDQSNDFSVIIQNLVKNDLKNFLRTSPPKNYPGFVRCRIKREKEGITQGFAATFSLYFNGKNENDRTFLLIARKHLTIGGHSEYLIGTDGENSSKNLNDKNSVAKLVGISITGGEYILYDHQNSSNNEQNKQQTGAIIYDEHIFGLKGPRTITVLLRDSDKTNRPSKENETIIDEWRSGHSTDLVEIKNKTPVYEEESKSYTITFKDSPVKQPSHKNFLLIASNGGGEETCMQFGRIDENSFGLDYRYPFTAIQAFAIALSSFHNRFRN